MVHIRALLLSLLCTGFPVESLAQQGAPYPVRPVQIIVPSGPGTGHDILARVLGPKLSERWGTAVVTQNRVGATGNIGADFVAKSPPDGYTLMCIGISFATNPAINTKLPFDPVKSFAPIALLATSAMSVTVAPQFPAKSFREFVDAVKRQPGKFFYASPGNGTVQHLGMELIKRHLGANLVHVPYKTSAPALADLVGGQVHVMVVATQTAASFVNNGKLKMLVTMGPERSPAFPDIPTAKELGYPELQIETWYGLFAPAGTPPDLVSKLNADVNAVLREPDVRELLARQGQTTANGSPEAFAELVKTELARWRQVVSAAGIRGD